MKWVKVKTEPESLTGSTISCYVCEFFLEGRWGGTLRSNHSKQDVIAVSPALNLLQVIVGAIIQSRGRFEVLDLLLRLWLARESLQTGLDRPFAYFSDCRR